MKAFGFILIVLAFVVFYACFFQLAPWIAGTIPPGQWHDFGRIAVYVLIGWIGGVGLPLCFLIWGVILLLDAW